MGAVTVPGADGSDGIFNPNNSVTINLSQAATGAWDSASPVAGKGVYDPDKWAVVFKYQRVIIREGVTITFTGHPSGAPVVWLVSESVSITGDISLDGATGLSEGQGRALVSAAPGGFTGGLGGQNATQGGGGFGPGGGYYDGARNDHGNPGQYAEVGFYRYEAPFPRTYGNARILPLIGGSGGGGGFSPDPNRADGGGSAGGGAILIAVAGNMTLTGNITANGGNQTNGNRVGGAGSGGAIRIIADSVNGNGLLQAIAPTFGAAGRIRVEANDISLVQPGAPMYTAGFPGENAELWPEAGAPVVRLITLAGVPVPEDPTANLVNFAEADVPVATEDFAQLVIETENVDSQASVLVRVTPLAGTNLDYEAFHISSSNGVSTWHADLPLEQGFSAIQVRVVTQ